MNRHDRLYASATDTARRLGLLTSDEIPLAIAQARISSYISESGDRQSFPRPPAVSVGVSDSSLFAFDRKGFTCRGYLPLITHATLEFSSGMTFQWATPRETTACLSVQDMPAADEFWSIFKHMRDRAWAEHPRDKQVTLTWFTGSRPGVWVNQPGVSLEEFHRRQQVSS